MQLVSSSVTMTAPAAGSAVETTATCPAGTVLTGGGARVDNETNGQAVMLNDDYPVSTTQFRARAVQTGQPLVGNYPWVLVVTAICAPSP